MNKLILIIPFIIIACSKAPKKNFKTEEMNIKAEEVLTRADNFRYAGKYKEALLYYDDAATIYFMKWDKRKYALIELKKAVLYLKIKNYQNFKKVMDRVTSLNEYENLNLENEILGIQARYLAQINKTIEARKLLSTVIESHISNIDFEKGGYYISLYSDKISKHKINNEYLNFLEQALPKLKESYDDGELINLEGYVYILHQSTKIFLKSKKLVRSKKQIKIYEDIIKDMELSDQIINFLKLSKEYYTMMNQKKLVGHYSKLISEYKRRKAKL